MSPWLRRPKYTSLQRREMPSGLWARCPRCKRLIYQKELERNLQVCPRCGHHHRLSAPQRLAITLDPGSFVEFDAGLTSVDPLGFVGYAEKLEEARRRTGRAEAALCGMGTVHGFRTVVAVLDFPFMGGSMGSVVGEKVARAAERALQHGLPLVTFSASGGARMQEGALALMQLAKTSAAVARLHQERLPYISVMCDPTTGGVTASFAFLGDLILAEPGALIGFAGRRVIEQTIGRRLPETFQTAEFCLEHGLIDMIVPREQMRPLLGRLLRFFGAPRVGQAEPA
ncbi:MAG: acetyl-CoA carboxylase, carboxyltransferase subunit beta [Armatimonadota bacterium]|nr:acetyl-CoA carboxylase, carboxyltransferase subunit beta [Armatimonadota bacterium]MDR7426055.1 acetyl-CoA carboxylase, carboxyltransferase subunit beta [Armatimonadota bacterium]MDR7464708.1 acetyl-CoA carboxylase, carboxyltransferase subunit beta [Armatimonadota bacterium]MDR7469054.1 acetyl-CoA carboxylase, carboxyltransferase subunit beta [Armatimonadota bacterium]MDR7474256.1 acetyl-CoA carboxylase, carboxyltransferase subunit beta [Armatimonadota bacterium]